MSEAYEFDFSFEEIVKQANDAIIITNAEVDFPGPYILYVNDAFTKLTGYSREEVIGKTPRILQGDGTSDATKKIIRNALIQKKSVRVSIKNFSKRGQEYWHDLSIIPLHNSEGQVTHFAAIQREITEQKRIEQKLNDLSLIDSLTGTMNRRAFDEIILEHFEKRHTTLCHLMMMDIDNFKSINDTFGHQAGDDYLKAFVSTLEIALREQDSVARIGGEEFCVCLPEVDAGAAKKIAERVLQSISELDLECNGNNINTTLSIGITQIYKTDGSTKDAIARADKALYTSKSNGKNQFNFA